MSARLTLHVMVTARCGLSFNRYCRVALALVAMLTLAAVGCSEARGWKGSVKVGLVVPFYGYDSNLAYNVYFAVKQAIKERNQQGGVSGRKIELVTLDDENDPDAGEYQAREMVVDPDVIGVVGYISSDTAIKAVAAYHQAGLAVITLGATAEAITSPGYPEVFRMSPGDNALASDLLQALSGKLNNERIGIIDDGTPGHAAISEALARQSPSHGLALVYRKTVSPLLRDFDELTRGLESGRVETAFFAGGHHQAAALAPALRTTIPRVSLLASADSDTPDLVRIGGEGVVGTLYLGVGRRLSLDRPEANTFLVNYRALWGPAPSGHAVSAYDATNLLLEAVERASKTSTKPGRRAVVAELRGIGTRQGVGGPISFNERGELLGAAGTLYRVEGISHPGAIVD